MSSERERRRSLRPNIFDSSDDEIEIVDIRRGEELQPQQYHVVRREPENDVHISTLTRDGFEIVSTEILAVDTDEEEDDEGENSRGNLDTLDPNGVSIRDLITDVKRLLSQVLDMSAPEAFRQNSGPGYRYDFSSQVTADDLLPDREWRELLTIISSLRTRLGVERVLALGCPQLNSERQLFDQLLLRCSAELLSPLPGEDNAAAPSVNDLAQGISHSAMRRISSTANQTTSETPVNSSVTQESSSTSGSRDTNISQENISDIIEAGGSDSEKYTRTLSSLLSPMCVLDEATHSSQLFQCFVKLKDTFRSLLSHHTARPFAQVTTPKRKRKREEDDDESNSGCPSPKKKPKEADKENEQDEEDSCAICLEPWSTGGEHRVTCLKCGHLFGLSCITKWVKQAHSCPQCKAQAKISDIRNIFVRKITAEDTSERDRALRLLEDERKTRRQAELKEANTRKQLDMQIADMHAEIVQLQARLQKGGSYSGGSQSSLSQISTQITGAQNAGNRRFCLLHRINITQEASCRVFDHCPSMGMTVVSQKSPNTIFRGFGIKILARDFKPLSYLPLHSSMIRDMSFRPGTFDGMLLSGGMDKSVQLASVTSKCIIQKYSLTSTVWCCAWNTNNTNLFYAGMERGVVKEFDIRNTSSHVSDILDTGGSPITSLQYWNGDETNGNFKGLLIGQMQTLLFYEQKESQCVTHTLPHLPASLMSLSLHSSGKFLGSFRPSSNLTKCRYEVCGLEQRDDGTENSITSKRLTLWDGSKVQAVISRNCLISHPDSEGDILAVTANHSNSTVNIWDVNKHREFQNLTSYDKALDIRPVVQGAPDAVPLLGALTDKDLILYQWR